jgi:uncharacterized protein (DUF952 family)
MSSTIPQKIYKIVPAPDWEEARKTGVFHGSAVDLRDGFIHFSAESQLGETAQRYFRGQDGLLLVAADAGALGSALRWEPSRGGELFPHLYAPLPLSAVVWMEPMPLGPDGRHRFPEGIA